jgi:diguanylate cyclase (GGDEF)-like protein
MEEHHEQAPGPRHRRRFLVRAFIFLALAAIAQASVALPPGPTKPAFYWTSLAVLVACALSLLLPWGRFPRWAVLVPTLAYLVSVTLLLISGGTNPSVQSTAGGLSALVLLPVLGMALYYPRSYAVIVIGAAMVSLTVAGIAMQSSDATDVRRLFLWTAVSVVMAVTIHHLRVSLERKVRDSTDLARVGRLMNSATQSLTSLRDPKAVISEGTKVMADVVGPGFGAAWYVRVSDGVVIQEVVFDDHASLPTSYLLRDDPYVGEVWETGTPLVVDLHRMAMGPTLRAITDDVALVYATFIPITVNGQVHGIIRIERRDTMVSEEDFSRCRALGNVVELALGNAIAHQELEMQANTDPLTGLSNRRGLALYLDGDRRHNAMSVLVLDIDGLKGINDHHGHDVGDKMLVSVARAASGVLRRGDLLARTGGDEFVAVVGDADESDARRVADRIQDAVSRVKVQGVRTTVSIGFACCGKNGDIDRVRLLADEAMYETKRVERRPHARHPRPREATTS